MTKGLENGFSISRRYFDQEILDMATQNGAKLIKEKIINIKKIGNAWVLKSDSSTFSTRLLVGADGVNSIVRSKDCWSYHKREPCHNFRLLGNWT